MDILLRSHTKRYHCSYACNFHLLFITLNLMLIIYNLKFNAYKRERRERERERESILEVDVNIQQHILT